MSGLLSALNFLRRPAHEAIPHHEVRYVAATHAENVAARNKSTGIQCELAIYAATIPLKQRKAETEAFFAARRQSPMSIEARDA